MNSRSNSLAAEADGTHLLHIMEDSSGAHSHWVLIGQGMTSAELSGLLASLFELDVATHQAVGVLRPAGGSEVCSMLITQHGYCKYHLLQACASLQHHLCAVCAQQRMRPFHS
jgi:hypothetical protein